MSNTNKKESGATPLEGLGFTPGPWKVHNLNARALFPHVTIGHSKKGQEPRIIVNCSHDQKTAI